MLAKAWMALMALTLVVTAAARAEEGWTEDYAAALKAAKEAKKLVLADFTGSDWCPPCKSLHAEVLVSDEFKAWAKDNVVLLTLDYPSKNVPQSDELKKQNAELRTKHAIRGYPTIMIMNEKGEEIARLVGYRKGQGAAAWLASLKEEMNKKKDEKKEEPKEPKAPTDPKAPTEPKPEK